MYRIQHHIALLEETRASQFNLEKVADKLRDHYKNLGTLAIVFSKINTHIKALFGDNSEEYKRSRKILKLAHEEVEIRVRKAQKRKWEKNENPLEMKRTKLEELSRPVEQSWENLAIKCATCTGLRLIEVLSDTAVNLDLLGIQASNLAKKTKPFEHTRPVIFVSPDIIVEDIKKLRELTFGAFPDLFAGPGIRREGITKGRVTQVLGEKLRKHLHSVMPKDKIKFHDLRALYAAVSFSDHAEPTASFPCWISRVLGHEPESLESVLNYYPVRII